MPVNVLELVKEETMRAIVITEPGDPDVLRLQEVAPPSCGPDEVLIDVSATAVNRADVLQRRGFYPAPTGASPYPGLECSGVIRKVGDNVTAWSVGDHVCALLTGGGYAEQVAVPAAQVMPIPQGVSIVDAAALPEVCCTVYLNMVLTAGVQDGDWVLVHGGSGGIGSMAIQMLNALGARVIVTAGTDEKCQWCRDLGATTAINYRQNDFVDEVKTLTDGRGVDIILDNMGAKYLQRNISALATGGRLVVIGMQGGVKGELNLGQLLTKQGSLYATSLRARGIEEKRTIVDGVVSTVWPLIEQGVIKPLIDRQIPLADAREAHELMESSTHRGKIVLTVKE